MQRFTLVLILFGSLVQCRFTPGDRQWEEEDNRQHCIEKCDKDCEYCNPRKCSESEDNCGTVASEIHPNCPPHEVCVPSGCQCK